MRKRVYNYCLVDEQETYENVIHLHEKQAKFLQSKTLYTLNCFIK